MVAKEMAGGAPGVVEEEMARRGGAWGAKQRSPGQPRGASSRSQWGLGRLRIIAGLRTVGRGPAVPRGASLLLGSASFSTCAFAIQGPYGSVREERG